MLRLYDKKVTIQLRVTTTLIVLLVVVVVFVFMVINSGQRLHYYPTNIGELKETKQSIKKVLSERYDELKDDGMLGEEITIVLQQEILNEVLINNQILSETQKKSLLMELIKRKENKESTDINAFLNFRDRLLGGTDGFLLKLTILRSFRCWCF